jgi:nitroimidazol reductase NimA-like FMN-containing flavoprotein (pyridoxamine 5'-phosphate oxidase superfamily)
MTNGLQPRAAPIRAPAGYGFPTSDAGLLSWGVVERLLDRARTYWLGTILPDGRPYATPLWAVWVDGAVYFDGMPSTRWARNLAANPAIEIHLEADGIVVMLEGNAEDLETDEELGSRIVMAWESKYGHGAPEPVKRGLFRLKPDAARAWSESLRDGTRWTFGVEALS